MQRQPPLQQQPLQLPPQQQQPQPQPLQPQLRPPTFFPSKEPQLTVQTVRATLTFILVPLPYNRLFLLPDGTQTDEPVPVTACDGKEGQ